MNKIRDFLSDMAAHEIVQGKEYDLRIEIDDGGHNSYIGFLVYTEDFRRKSPVTRELNLLRHTNSVDKLANTWEFSLGSVCHAYADHPDILLEFTTYGKTPEEAESEARGYLEELKNLIRERTADYQTEAARLAQEERETLLARLQELEG